jgi:hypothetical protein
MSRKITPTYILLNQITLAAAVNSVTLSSIPQNFSDIVVVWDGLLTSSGTYSFRVNSLTSSVYSSVWAIGNSNNNQVISSTGAANSANDRIPCVIYTGTPSSGRINGTWNLLDYSAVDKHKSILFRGSGVHEVVMTAGRVAITDPITSVTVYTPQEFITGSTFSLYGVHA